MTEVARPDAGDTGSRETGAADGGRGMQRRLLVGTVVAVLVVIGLMAGGPWLYARLVAPQAAPPLGLTTAAPASTTAGEPGTGPLTVDGRWRVGDGSQAGYRLQEVLSGRPVTVVGRTDEVTGSLVVADGVLTEAEVVVGTASISTDESARDAYYRRAMDTTAHPRATFVLVEPVDVSALGLTAGPTPLTAVGTLTFHGVSRPVTVSLDARRVADGIEIAGTVPVLLADYGLPAPDLGFVSVDPGGTVEVLLRLSR